MAFLKFLFAADIDPNDRLLCGLGGANFSSSMANISFFFPKAEKGTAMGLNAGLGNLGVSVAQFVVPLVITAGLFGALGGGAQTWTEGGASKQIWLQNAGFVWVPFIIASSLAAWFGMNDLASAKAGFAEQAVIFKRKHNWIMCFIYLGTFGSFLGFSAGFPLLIQTAFPAVNPVKYAFLGPLVGGYLVQYASWHWIFLINIPFGIIGILCAIPIMPDVYGNVARFDGRGFLLIATTATGLTLALEIAPHGGTNLPWALLLGVLSCASGLAYLRHARRSDHPIFPINLILVRTFRIGLIGNLVSRLGIGAMPFLLPLLYQLAFGYSASLSGWLMTPTVVGAILSKPFVKPVIDRFGYRRTILTNTCLLGMLMMSVAIPPQHTPLWIWVTLLFVIGLGNSLQFTAMNTLSIADLRPDQNSSGNSLLSVNMQLSTSFGIAIGALLLKTFSLDGISHGDLHTAFRYTFVAVGSITFASALIFSRLHDNDGAALLSR